ncbi:MAG: putative nicotinamide N-methyase [Bermanella sp.]|jgi:predicted nicotinamide N-methyase
MLDMSSSMHSREAYGIISLTSRHPDLRRLKNEQSEPSLHGNKLWGSCYLLMEYLQENPLDAGCKVMDIGCGWGLEGIYCAKTFGASVTAIDADPAVFSFLNLLAQHNAVTIETQIKRFEEITEDELAAYDVLIGADICFWDELADTVYQLIERAITAGVKRIILTDPQRPPFTDIAERCVDLHYGELQAIETAQPRRFTGSVLVIENN